MTVSMQPTPGWCAPAIPAPTPPLSQPGHPLRRPTTLSPPGLLPSKPSSARQQVEAAEDTSPSPRQLPPPATASPPPAPPRCLGGVQEGSPGTCAAAAAMSRRGGPGWGCGALRPTTTPVRPRRGRPTPGAVCGCRRLAARRWRGQRRGESWGVQSGSGLEVAAFGYSCSVGGVYFRGGCCFWCPHTRSLFTEPRGH